MKSDTNVELRNCWGDDMVRCGRVGCRVGGGVVLGQSQGHQSPPSSRPLCQGY